MSISILSKKPNSSWAFLFLILIFPLLTLASDGNSNSEVSFSDLHFKPFAERATDSTSQKLLATGFASMWLAQTTDSVMRDQHRNYQTMPEQTADIGDGIEKYGLGPIIALGQYYFDQDNGISHIRSLIYNGAVTITLKQVIGRRRPDGSNTRSMPSGHSSSSFASATALTYSYGWKAGVVAYPIATFVAMSRMADDVHWFSDVVAGAFIGIWTGRAASYKASEIKPNSAIWFAYPVITSQNQGFQFEISY